MLHKCLEKPNKKMKPYLQLGEQLAEIAIQLLKKAPEKIDIAYYGDLVEEDTSLLTRYMVKGILSYHLSDSVNLINAIHLLKEHGLSYNVQRNATNKGFANYMELVLYKGDKKKSISVRRS